MGILDKMDDERKESRPRAPMVEADRILDAIKESLTVVRDVRITDPVDARVTEPVRLRQPDGWTAISTNLEGGPRAIAGEDKRRARLIVKVTAGSDVTISAQMEGGGFTLSVGDDITLTHTDTVWATSDDESTLEIVHEFYRP